MLTEKDLDEFAEYLNSGQCETDFRDGCENDRHHLLNLLEKFMDVADVCDETATRLIFRGNPLLAAGPADSGPIGSRPVDPVPEKTVKSDATDK